MQIGLAADLLGLDVNNQDDLNKAYDALQDPAVALDLAAANIARNEALMGRPLKGSEAAFAHNMGVARYKDYLAKKPNPPSDKIAKRSVNYQNGIARALQGYIDVKPDSWDKNNPDVAYPFPERKY